MRWLAPAALASVVAVLAAPASAGVGLQLTEVGRLTFPQRAYVVDLPSNIAVGRARVSVTENGKSVSGVTLTPVSSSDLSLGAVLAIDSSDSMRGAPEQAALNAAREFIAKQSPNQQVGLLTFNASTDVLRDPTGDSNALREALSAPPQLAYGTRIYDALNRSLDMLETSQVSSGSIVLLSDGADVGSKSSLSSVLARAKRDNVRIFTVGLKSRVFDSKTLQLIALGTRGSYAEAGSASQLASIYSSLGSRLASEYVVEYTSEHAAGDAVEVNVNFAGYGSGSIGYVASDSSATQPFKQSASTRFFQSISSLVLVGLIVAALVAGAMLALLRKPETTVVDRVGAFVTAEPTRRQEKRKRRHAQSVIRSRVQKKGLLERWWERLADDFETAGIGFTPAAFCLGAVVATVLAALVLATISTPFALVAIVVPVFARSWVSMKVRRLRAAFAEQLPDTLQLLASALRTGHSFIGAMSVVVERSAQPIQGEFRRVLTDDQLGLPIEGSLRSIARRMESRDMEQVALLSELQRIAGGNSAEVLDVVVDTVRERADVRRLARTLTAQGRLSRWILTVMPIVMGGFLWLTQRSLMHPLFSTTAGQFAIAVAALMMVAGSYWIREIIDIKV